jgi:riboflavin kinase/FMN adenylyltransferase
MRIFRNAFEAGRWAPGSVVTIGKFDGMHRGHQKLIRAAVKKAKTAKTRCMVVTFDLSPQQFLRLYPYQPILSEAKKIEILGKLGVDAVVLIPFDENLACMSPESFAELVLAAQLKAKHVYVGEDFCFGKDRAGSLSTLEELGPRMGFKVHSVPLARIAGEKIMAVKIRALIEDGCERKAEKLLGRKLEDHK